MPGIHHNAEQKSSSTEGLEAKGLKQEKQRPTPDANACSADERGTSSQNTSRTISPSGDMSAKNATPKEASPTTASSSGRAGLCYFDTCDVGVHPVLDLSVVP